MYLKNGIKITDPITINSVVYSVDWLTHASDAQLAALGVTHAADPVIPDPNLYTYTTNADGTLAVVSRTADDLAAILIAKQTALISQIDSDVDRIYQDAVGNRTSEYQVAQTQASAFKTAGYTGTVPATVQQWADLNSQTTQWAADNILAQAGALLSAQLAIRAQRLASKALVRAAADVAALTTAQTGWAAFVTYIRGALGLSS